MSFKDLVEKRNRDREAEHERREPVSDVAHVEVTAEAERGDILLADVEKFIGRFGVHPSEHARVAHVLWVGHTHLMDKWDSTPRLAFLSAEPASGKTRMLEVSELLVPSPVQAVNVSPAYLFRKVGDQDGCTILFDEIDTVFGPKAKENEEIRGLLNAGHRRGAVAGRCVTHGKVVSTEDIPAYCAVALAGIGWLPDTILSRSVLIRMQRRKPGERVEPFRRRIELAAGHRLRDRLAKWAALAAGSITFPEMPAGVEDRDADVWEALIAVADAASGDWPKRAREAAKALIKEAHDVEPSLGIRLLADLKTVFGDVEQMTTEAILRALCAMPEAPWNDLRGKPLNERGLAQRLRPYGVKPKVIRVGEATPRGYTRESLHDPWLAYLPPSPPDGSATSATSETDDEKLNLFSGKAVADDRRGERNSPATSATRAADVADSVAHVADDVADKGEKNISKSNGVADVADVVHLPAADDLSIPACLDRRAEANRVCAHCGQPGGLPVAYGEALATVHPDCRDAWLRTQFSRTTAAGSSQ